MVLFCLCNHVTITIQIYSKLLEKCNGKIFYELVVLIVIHTNYISVAHIDHNLIIF